MRAVIVNPHSSRSQGGVAWREMREEVLSRLGGAQEFLTQKPGDATRFAREAALSGVEMLVVAGGDGTINEVVNGLFNEAGEPLNPKIVMGLLSVGRGCDLRRTLGVSANFRDAVGSLLNPKIKTMDIGRVVFKDEFGRDKTSHFANGFSAGLSGNIIRKVNEASGVIPPQLTYFGLSALEFLTNPGYPMEVISDGKKIFEGQCLNVFVSNGQYCGAGMKWAPKAKLDDGLFNITILEKIPKHRLIFSSHRIYKGTFNILPGIHEFTGKEILINSQKQVLLEIDGEQPGLLPAHISLLKQGLQVAT